MKDSYWKTILDRLMVCTTNTWVLLLCCMLIFRVIFAIELFFRAGISAGDMLTVLGGAKFDILITSHIALATSLPVALLGIVWKRLDSVFSNTLCAVFSLISALLLEYYCATARPLDNVVCSYTFSEIISIVSSSTTFSLAPIISVLTILAVSFFTVRLLKDLYMNMVLRHVIFVLCFVLCLAVKYKEYIARESGYSSHSDFCLAVNQLSYSYIRISDFAISGEAKARNTDIAEAADAYHRLMKDHTYSGTQFPFWRKFDERDVLGDLLQKTPDGAMPNFVFVIIEGFGRKLTGVERPMYSFTPFLDSLAQSGLFWGNCISSAERTFGAVPAVFASAPHGYKGFASKWEPIPDHNSLLADLSANGYRCSFFYGGSTAFDGQNMFLSQNGVSYIADMDADTTSQRYKSLKENYRWGLDDDEMITNALATKRTMNYKRFADVYMTLSTHEPYEIDDIERYKNEILNEYKFDDSREAENVLSNLNIFACFRYMDRAIRKLYEYYRSQPDFDRTIFVICGDHRMYPLGIGGNPLSKYNIPLIISSPLVKSPKTMRGVVSQYDIAPSINAYLRSNYDYSCDDMCHWLGTSFDTSATFHCAKHQAFMLNSRDVTEFLSDSIFLSFGHLYRVGDNLELTPFDDGHTLDSLSALLQNYQTISCDAVRNSHLKYSNLKEQKVLISSQNYFDGNDSILAADTDGRMWHLIDSSCLYYGICKNHVFDTACSKTTLAVQFDFRTTDSTECPPSLACSVSGDETYYFSFGLYDDTGRCKNTNRPEHFEGRLIIPDKYTTTNAELKLYFYNHRHLRMYIDNINVELSCSR